MLGAARSSKIELRVAVGGDGEGGAAHSGLNLEGVTGLVNRGNGAYDLHFLIALVSAAGAWRRKLHQAIMELMERSVDWMEASILKSILRTTGEFMARVMGNGWVGACTVTED